MYIIECLLEPGDRLLQGGGLDSRAEHAEKLSSSPNRFYNEIEVMQLALPRKRDFSMRFDSRTQDFLLDGGQSRTLCAGEDLDISATDDFLGWHDDG